jgi:hypothetical protein
MVTSSAICETLGKRDRRKDCRVYGDIRSDAYGNPIFVVATDYAIAHFTAGSIGRRRIRDSVITLYRPSADVRAASPERRLRTQPGSADAHLGSPDPFKAYLRIKHHR